MGIVGVQNLSKGAFLDMLKGAAKVYIHSYVHAAEMHILISVSTFFQDGGSSESGKSATTKQDKAADTWAVLNDDYMMGSSMKKWKSGEAADEVPEDVSDFDSEEEVGMGVRCRPNKWMRPWLLKLFYVLYHSHVLRSTLKAFLSTLQSSIVILFFPPCADL